MLLADCYILHVLWIIFQITNEEDRNIRENFNISPLNGTAKDSLSFEKYIYGDFIALWKVQEESRIERSCIMQMGGTFEVKGITINFCTKVPADPGKYRADEYFAKSKRNDVLKVNGRSSIDSADINAPAKRLGCERKEDSHLMREKDEIKQSRKLLEPRRYEIHAENYSREDKFVAQEMCCTVKHLSDAFMISHQKKTTHINLVFPPRGEYVNISCRDLQTPLAERVFRQECQSLAEKELFELMSRSNAAPKEKQENEKKKLYVLYKTRMLLNHLVARQTKRWGFGTTTKLSLKSDDSRKEGGNGFFEGILHSIDERECRVETSLDPIFPDDADKVVLLRSGRVSPRLDFIDTEYKDQTESERDVVTDGKVATDDDVDDDNVGEDFTTWQTTRITDQYFRPLLRTTDSALGRTVFPGREEIKFKVDEITIHEETESTLNRSRQISTKTAISPTKERNFKESKSFDGDKGTLMKRELKRDKSEALKESLKGNYRERTPGNKENKMSFNLRSPRRSGKYKKDDVNEKNGDTLILDYYDADYGVPEIVNEEYRAEEMSEELGTSTTFYDDMSDFEKIMEHRSTVNETFTENAMTVFQNAYTNFSGINDSQPVTEDSEWKKFLDTYVNIRSNQSILYKIFNDVLNFTNTKNISTHECQQRDKREYFDDEMKFVSALNFFKDNYVILEKDLNTASPYLFLRIAKRAITEQWLPASVKFGNRFFKKTFAPSTDFLGKHDDNNLAKKRGKLNFTKTWTNLNFATTGRDSSFRMDKDQDFSGKYSSNLKSADVKYIDCDMMLISLIEDRQSKKSNKIRKTPNTKSARMYYVFDDKKSNGDVQFAKYKDEYKEAVDRENIPEGKESRRPTFTKVNDNFNFASLWNGGRKLLSMSASRNFNPGPRSLKRIRKRRDRPWSGGKSLSFTADENLLKRAKRKIKKMAHIVMNVGSSRANYDSDPRVNVVKIMPIRLVEVMPVAKSDEYSDDRRNALNIQDAPLECNYVPFFKETPNERPVEQKISLKNEDERNENLRTEYGNSQGISFQRDFSSANNSGNFSANLSGGSIKGYSDSPGQFKDVPIMKITDPPDVNATRKTSYRLSIDSVTKKALVKNKLSEPLTKHAEKNLSNNTNPHFPKKNVPEAEYVDQSTSSGYSRIKANHALILPCDENVNAPSAQKDWAMVGEKGDKKWRDEGNTRASNMLALAEDVSKLTKIVSTCEGRSNVVNEIASHAENILLVPKPNGFSNEPQEILFFDGSKNCKGCCTRVEGLSGGDSKLAYQTEDGKADFPDAIRPFGSALQNNSQVMSDAKRGVDSEQRLSEAKQGNREKRRRPRRKKKKRKKTGRRKMKKKGRKKYKKNKGRKKNRWLFNKRQLLSVFDDENVFASLSDNYAEDRVRHTFEESLGQRWKKWVASYGIAEERKQGDGEEPMLQCEVRLPSKMNKKLHSRIYPVRTGRRDSLRLGEATSAARRFKLYENESDKIVVGFALVPWRRIHAGYFRKTCLTVVETPGHYGSKCETVETERPGYWLSNFAIASYDPIEPGMAGNGSPESPDPKCHSPHVSAVDTVNVRSRYNAIFRYQRLRGEPRSRNRKYLHTRKPIARGNISTFHAHKLSADGFLASTEIRTMDGKMIAQTEVNQGQLLNRTDKSTFVRRLNMQRMDFSVRLWHCFCVYVSCVDGLGCNSLSPGHYHSEEYSESKCNEKPRLLNNIKDVLIFSTYFTTILLLLGLVKGLIGLFAPAVARYGLDSLLDKRKMDKYFEEDLKFRTVVTDDTGAPVHPDTRRKTVRICSRKLELLLNLVFFLTYPMIVCCFCCKNLLLSKRSYCQPDDSKVHLIKEIEQRPKLIRVSTYGDCRNSMMEAEDTEYVLNELKKSQESLANVKNQTKKRHRTGSTNGETVGKFARDLLKQRVVFRNLTMPIGDLDMPAGVLYSLRGYFMKSEDGGYLFVTSCPFKQYWTISEGSGKAVVPPRIYQSSLFTRSFDTAADVHDSDELSSIPKGICINVQFLDDR